MFSIFSKPQQKSLTIDSKRFGIEHLKSRQITQEMFDEILRYVPRDQLEKILTK